MTEPNWLDTQVQENTVRIVSNLAHMHPKDENDNCFGCGVSLFGLYDMEEFERGSGHGKGCVWVEARALYGRQVNQK